MCRTSLCEHWNHCLQVWPLSLLSSLHLFHCPWFTLPPPYRLLKSQKVCKTLYMFEVIRPLISLCLGLLVNPVKKPYSLWKTHPVASYKLMLFQHDQEIVKPFHLVVFTKKVSKGLMPRSDLYLDGLGLVRFFYLAGLFSSERSSCEIKFGLVCCRVLGVVFSHWYGIWSDVGLSLHVFASVMLVPFCVHCFRSSVLFVSLIRLACWTRQIHSGQLLCDSSLSQLVWCLLSLALRSDSLLLRLQAFFASTWQTQSCAFRFHQRYTSNKVKRKAHKTLAKLKRGTLGATGIRIVNNTLAPARTQNVFNLAARKNIQSHGGCQQIGNPSPRSNETWLGHPKTERTNMHVVLSAKNVSSKESIRKKIKTKLWRSPFSSCHGTSQSLCAVLEPQKRIQKTQNSSELQTEARHCRSCGRGYALPAEWEGCGFLVSTRDHSHRIAPLHQPGRLILSRFIFLSWWNSETCDSFAAQLIFTFSGLLILNAGTQLCTRKWAGTLGRGLLQGLSPCVSKATMPNWRNSFYLYFYL